MEEEKFTLYEEDFFEERREEEETVQIITFRLEQEWYGVNIISTREVINLQNLAYLPSSPSHISGIVNLRGIIMPVTDLKKIFGLSSFSVSPKPRLLVVEYEGLETGLVVDDVDDVVTIPVSKIDPTLPTIPLERAEFLEGECKIDNKMVGILKVDKIFSFNQTAERVVK